jgi:DNA (cytosine-5)-methyltransferase 1
MPKTFIDLFCGIGSFHQALVPLGWTCVMASDINPHACATYEANYGLRPKGDILHINPDDVPEYDLVCAGFPCQPFSNIGKHLGLEDERGTLFYQVMKFIERPNPPKAVLLENVPGLLSHAGGSTFQAMLSRLTEAGYTCSCNTLVCSDYGIPQRRKRVFVMATRIPPARSFDYNAYKISTTLAEYMGKPYERTVAYTLRCGGRNSPIGDKHNWDGYIVDGQPYRLTLADGLRLQGFPESFVLKGSSVAQWKQLGNTIPTALTKVVALALTDALT